ncbi:MAG: hypothetical protein DRO18_08420 [Thermoprotei archaeon]|nr:MAG: hypothetical protein DRO18_08420 [Thermoprotei archaeon]
MKLRREPMEGDMLVLVDGSLWMVKGCYHPQGYVVATPRYVRGRKLKRYREAMEYVHRYYRHYIKYVPEVGSYVPLIPLDNVKKIMYALDFRCELIRFEKLRRLCSELINLITGSCNLRCGVTGSLLGGYYSITSDIDIVCLDKKGAYECLKKLREDGLLRRLDYWKVLHELIDVSEILDMKSHLRSFRWKVLQGEFQGVSYTIRVIECSRLNDLLGPYITCVISPKVIGIVEHLDYRTPAIYRVNVLKAIGCESLLSHNYDVIALSHRIRFTELPKGSLLDVTNAYVCIKDQIALINLDLSSHVLIA